MDARLEDGRRMPQRLLPAAAVALLHVVASGVAVACVASVQRGRRRPSTATWRRLKDRRGGAGQRESESEERGSSLVSPPVKRLHFNGCASAPFSACWRSFRMHTSRSTAMHRRRASRPLPVALLCSAPARSGWSRVSRVSLLLCLVMRSHLPRG